MHGLKYSDYTATSTELTQDYTDQSLSELCWKQKAHVSSTITTSSSRGVLDAVPEDIFVVASSDDFISISDDLVFFPLTTRSWSLDVSVN